MRSTNLFSNLFDDEKHVGPVADSERESVFKRVTAIMVVADAVLIDVVHSEGVCLTVMLTVAGTLDGTMTRSLNDSECNRVLLKKRERHSQTCGK